VPEIGKKRGMDFAPALHTHKETVIVLSRVVNPADARRARGSAIILG
jgi:hypothetical protein